MRARKAKASPATRRRLVLVFGENENDRAAIRHLTEGLRPDLKGLVETRRQPLVLIKNATAPNARKSAERIAGLVRQETAAREVLAVLAHEDCDALEPAHQTVAARIEGELAAAGCPAPLIAVTPCWEIEAWWMIFPEAVGKLVERWREPNDWIGRDVGQVRNAKEALARAVQPRGATKSPPRQYEESDSISIAENAARDGLLSSFRDGCRESHHVNGVPKRTRSASFEAFRTKVLGI